MKKYHKLSSSSSSLAPLGPIIRAPWDQGQLPPFPRSPHSHVQRGLLAFRGPFFSCPGALFFIKITDLFMPRGPFFIKITDMFMPRGPFWDPGWDLGTMRSTFWALDIGTFLGQYWGPEQQTFAMKAFRREDTVEPFLPK